MPTQSTSPDVLYESHVEPPKPLRALVVLIAVIAVILGAWYLIGAGQPSTEPSYMFRAAISAVAVLGFPVAAFVLARFGGVWIRVDADSLRIRSVPGRHGLYSDVVLPINRIRSVESVESARDDDTSIDLTFRWGGTVVRVNTDEANYLIDCDDPSQIVDVIEQARAAAPA